MDSADSSKNQKRFSHPNEALDIHKKYRFVTIRCLSARREDKLHAGQNMIKSQDKGARGRTTRYAPQFDIVIGVSLVAGPELI
jgi:hypothetical protein